MPGCTSVAIRCNPAAKGVPKHGSNKRSGQNYPQRWDYLDGIPPYVQGGHDLLSPNRSKYLVIAKLLMNCLYLVNTVRQHRENK